MQWCLCLGLKWSWRGECIKTLHLESLLASRSWLHWGSSGDWLTFTCAAAPPPTHCGAVFDWEWDRLESTYSAGTRLSNGPERFYDGGDAVMAIRSCWLIIINGCIESGLTPTAKLLSEAENRSVFLNRKEGGSFKMVSVSELRRRKLCPGIQPQKRSRAYSVVKWFPQPTQWWSNYILNINDQFLPRPFGVSRICSHHVISQPTQWWNDYKSYRWPCQITRSS